MDRYGKHGEFMRHARERGVTKAKAEEYLGHELEAGCREVTGEGEWFDVVTTRWYFEPIETDPAEPVANARFGIILEQ